MVVLDGCMLAIIMCGLPKTETNKQDEEEVADKLE